MAKKVEVIRVIDKFIDEATNIVIKKKRVCAYARVSTDEADQLNSYQNQIDEFTNRINNNNEWEFAGMFSDEGISGTNLKKRAGFNRMIDSARGGHIDLILTKSISRFGRNTVDVLSTIQELRKLNVEIYFEKENLYSSDPKVDFLLTIMSSIAQEESRNISENIKWSVKKRFKEGKLIINTKNFLGFDKDNEGNLVINQEQAKTIKYIFNLFIVGFGPQEIAKILTKENIPTGTGSINWNYAAVKRILRNEKYCGDAVLQKRVTIDYLSHKTVENNNIEPKYYVHENHEPIIPKEEYKLVQKLLDSKEYSYSETKKSILKTSYPLTGLLYCAYCKRPMKRQYWGYGKNHEKVVLNCKHANKKTIKPCEAKVIDNDILESAGYDVFKTMFKNQHEYKKLLMNLIEKNLYNDDIEDLIKKTKEKIDKLNTELVELINSKVKNIRYSDEDFNNTYKAKKVEIANLNKEISELEYKFVNNHLLKEKMEMLEEFINNDKSLSLSFLFKSLFALIIGKNRDDVIFVITPKVIEQSTLIDKMDEIINYDKLFCKTHFDANLRKNIRYEVVIYEED